jgi:two-component system, OmpR family, phosphate regulon sensor histidine kinase PhoR
MAGQAASKRLPLQTSQRLIAIITVLMVLGVLTFVGDVIPPNAFVFTWRWYGYLVSAAIIINIGVLIYMLAKTTYRKGAFYWFIGFAISNITYLSLVLAESMNATPDGAAFWQGLWPLGYLAIGAELLFFVYSYVGDTALPRNIYLWLSVMVGTSFLMIISAGTNLLEYHVPHNSQLLYWGYQNEPGEAQSLVFLWMFVIIVAIMTELIKAYRRAVSQTAKRQLMVFIVALGQYLAVALVCDLLIYSISPTALPPMAFFHFTLVAVLIAFGINRYGLFQLSPASLAEPILENLSEAVIGVNNELKIEFANQGTEAIFNLKSEVLRGRALQELFPERDYARVKQELGNGDNFNLEDLAVQSAAGKQIPVILSVRPAEGDHGQRAGYIVVVQNVSELKKKTIELAQEKASVERKIVERTKELHDERARLRASIDSLSVGFLLVDRHGDLVVQNRALQRILDMAEPARSLDELAGRMGRYKLRSRSEEAQKARHIIQPTEVAIGAKVVRVFMAPVEADAEPGHEPAVLGSVVLIEDITEAKVLERSRDEFFSIASHELRTPLTAIRGNTSMLLSYYDQDLKNPEIIGMIRDVHDSSTNLIAIVNDFLDMSRLEQGKMAFEIAPFAIEPLVENLAYEMKTVIQENKLEFHTDVKQLDRLPQVFGDKTRTRQILYNLIGNAVKFTDKGKIELNAQLLPHNMVEILVSDTGRGISQESRKMLFHKFQQAGDSLLTRDTSRGTGLGLYISRLMARNMGGDLKLVKTEEGGGSTFSFTIPVATEERLRAAGKDGRQKVSVKTGLTLGSTADK